MTASQPEDPSPQEPGVKPEQTEQDEGESCRAIVLPLASETPLWDMPRLSDTISPDVVRNVSTRMLLTLNVKGMERNVEKLSKDLEKEQAELKKAGEKITDLTVKLALAQHKLEAARKEQTTSSFLITVGMLLLGAAVELRNENVVVLSLVGGIGVVLSSYGWLGFRQKRGDK